MTPVRVALTAWRNARYVEELLFTAPVLGNDEAAYDLTSWAARMQVRLYGAQAGDPKIDLVNVTTDIEGVWIIEPTQGVVRIRIDEDTLIGLWAALGGPAEAGGSITLKYDLVLTSPAGGDEVWTEGDFILQPGVTV